MLLEIDNLFISNYFGEDIIKKCEKLPKKIKISLDKGKLIDKKWESNNLYSNINDCINIENNIKNINEINEIINKCDIKNKIKFYFNPKENQLNEFLKSISNLGIVEAIEDSHIGNSMYNHNFILSIISSILNK